MRVPSTSRRERTCCFTRCSRAPARVWLDLSAMTSSRSAANPRASVIRAALTFVFVFGTAGIFVVFDQQLLSPELSRGLSTVIFAWLFAAVLVGALTVVANADELALIF